MREALQALNALAERGVVETYAIGGAIGAAFYIDAVQTEDIDAFIYLPPADSGLIDLGPIYAALVELGGSTEREYVRFAEWPLQILPDATPLIRMAIEQAITVDFEDIPTRVFRPEHLCCIALQTGRTKDLLRVKSFLEQEKVAPGILEEIAASFGLSDVLVKVEGL